MFDLTLRTSSRRKHILNVTLRISTLNCQYFKLFSIHPSIILTTYLNNIVGDGCTLQLSNKVVLGSPVLLYWNPNKQLQYCLVITELKLELKIENVIFSMLLYTLIIYHEMSIIENYCPHTVFGPLQPISKLKSEKNSVEKIQLSCWIHLKRWISVFISCNLQQGEQIQGVFSLFLRHLFHHFQQQLRNDCGLNLLYLSKSTWANFLWSWSFEYITQILTYLFLSLLSYYCFECLHSLFLTPNVSECMPVFMYRPCLYPVHYQNQCEGSGATARLSSRISFIEGSMEEAEILLYVTDLCLTVSPQLCECFQHYQWILCKDTSCSNGLKDWDGSFS